MATVLAQCFHVSSCSTEAQQSLKKQCGSDGIQDSRCLGIILQTNTSLSPESRASGGKQAASDGTLPWFPLFPAPSAERHRKKRGTEDKLREGEGERSVKEEREKLDKMNYAKLSEAAIVGGAACVKASRP